MRSFCTKLKSIKELRYTPSRSFSETPGRNKERRVEGNAMVNNLMKEMCFLLCFGLFIVHLQTTTASSHGGSNGSDKVKVSGMHLPVLFKTSEPPLYICHHFRKVCYVPGVRNGWRGWYREGFSGYFIHQTWMYYVSKVRCPCLFPEPPSEVTQNQ